MRRPISILILSLCYGCAHADSVIGTLISCPSPWTQRKNSNSCYLFNHQDLVTFATARQQCQLQNADLLTISDLDEQDWINVETEYYKTDGWWIGLQWEDWLQDWGWIAETGIPMNQVGWSQQPDDYDNQDCDDINMFGRFSDDDCGTLFGYICKFQKQASESCPLNQNGQMTWYTDTNTNTCYYVSDPLDPKKRLSWSDAKTKCAQLHQNAQLLSITSQADSVFVQTLVQLSAKNQDMDIPWWTGLNDKATEGTYVWQDGSPLNVSLITWDIAPSPRSENQNCAVKYVGAVDDSNCLNRAFYACEKSAATNYMNFGCGSWKRAGNQCYMFGRGQTLAWQDARTQCKKNNGDLLKVNDFDSKYWLERQKLPGGEYWTGLNDQVKENEFHWADGTLANSTFIKWTQQPDNYESNEDCASIGQDGVYNDVNCNAHMGYICEYQRATTGVQCLSGWLPRPNSLSCYYISSSNSTDFISWSEVPRKCTNLVQANGLKASWLAVSTQDERVFIELQLAKLPLNSRPWWTGLSDRQNEGVWVYNNTNDMPANYLNQIIWNDEPNNFNGNENCATIQERGHYNDNNCQKKLHFICQRPVSVAAKSVPYSFIVMCLGILTASIMKS